MIGYLRQWSGDDVTARTLYRPISFLDIAVHGCCSLISFYWCFRAENWILIRMPRRCVYYGCSTQDKDLFKWPRNKAEARLWTAFVSVKRAQWSPSATSVLCSKHFHQDCFENLSKYSAGFAKRWVFIMFMTHFDHIINVTRVILMVKWGKRCSIVLLHKYPNAILESGTSSGPHFTIKMYFVFQGIWIFA